ncbi:hypothetical protein PFY01_08985 [Brevundimonas vesicularis]|uniref:hypothetical protein n=1 Tax=Brevundimonas vesicularis TaxID=41276 RepID=UPI0022EC68A6|nr:hypothetical protein [Brevundimonas vesicularis]WBT04794.1 hypothetical protein PFY01_08565 [Brevundimonas vesicularis]WBT04876.1 hypothetical protein PFY01_08985 [Brevundimonas vesicularis]
MARFIRWVAEPFTVFGIGALLNLILSAAAYAGVIGADRIDPDWIFLAGAAGASSPPWSTSGWCRWDPNRRPRARSCAR